MRRKLREGVIWALVYWAVTAPFLLAGAFNLTVGLTVVAVLLAVKAGYVWWVRDYRRRKAVNAAGHVESGPASDHP